MSLVVVRVVHVRRTMAGGTNRLIDLTGGRVSADLLDLVLQFLHLSPLRHLLNLLLLLLHLGLNQLLVHVLRLERVRSHLLQLCVWADRGASIGAVGEREFPAAARSAGRER